jgi:outer membrane lipoprotein-sorting protein
MKKYKILIFLFVLVAGVGVRLDAQPKGYKLMKDTTSFVRNFNEQSQQIATNEADFVQEKYISVMTENVLSKGRFYYKKNNQMRWESIEPSNHIIVLNNGKMMIREKGKVKTYDTNSNRMFRNLNDMMLTTASGNLLRSRDYSYQLFENEQHYLVVLTPVQATARKFVKTIDILIEKKDYTVAQIKMNEPSGDYTRITFANKKINKGIDDSLFFLQ